MAVRNAQHLKTSRKPWTASSATSGMERTHRSAKSRRAHSEAHRAQQSEKHRWMIVASLALSFPFAVAIAVVEMFH